MYDMSPLQYLSKTCICDLKIVSAYSCLVIVNLLTLILLIFVRIKHHRMLVRGEKNNLYVR